MVPLVSDYLQSTFKQLNSFLIFDQAWSSCVFAVTYVFFVLGGDYPIRQGSILHQEPHSRAVGLVLILRRGDVALGSSSHYRPHPPNTQDPLVSSTNCYACSTVILPCYVKLSCFKMFYHNKYVMLLYLSCACVYCVIYINSRTPILDLTFS